MTKEKESIELLSAEGVRRGRPPKDSQFQKGRSGNPAGRPKGAKNIATLLKEAAYDQATITDQTGKKRILTKIQLAVMHLVNKAARGDLKAVDQIMDRLEETERRAELARPVEPDISEADLEVLRTVHQRLTEAGR